MQVVDYEGRNALHMASACGRKELCQWLVRYAQADINARDVECGFTALHRSVFYGNLHVTIALMKVIIEHSYYFFFFVHIAIFFCKDLM